MAARELVVPIGMEGIVTVEAVAPDGRVTHRQEIHNVLTDQGLNALKFGALGNEMLQVCILGRSGAAAGVGNTLIPGLFDPTWGPAGGGSLADAYNLASPTPQVRSIVATSQDPGSATDQYAYVAGPPRYWRITRKRVFSRTDTYFRAATLPAASDFVPGVSAVWAADGWANLRVESSFIREIGFCGNSPTVPDVTNVVFAGVLGGGGDVNAPLWTGSTNLWNRIVLPQSIGYEKPAGEVDVYYPWQSNVADVLLPPDYVIRVTLEVRIYPDVSPAVQVLDVNGVQTTCTTRVIDVDDPGRWGGGGALDNFGSWRTDERSAAIGESDAMPAAVEDSYSPAGVEYADSGAKVSTPEAAQQVMKFTFGANKGLFSTGIGSLLHGQFNSSPLSSSWAYLTTFSPKIAKTNEQRHEFNVRYVWSRP